LKKKDTKILKKEQMQNISNGHVEGLLEYDGRRGGYLRKPSQMLGPNATDPYVPPELVSRFKLREASVIQGTIASRQHGHCILSTISSINGLPPERWIAVEEFTRRTAIDPFDRLTLTSAADETAMRIVDLLCPVGKGQRALIVSPPKAGKTILMHQFADAISKHHPEIDLLLLLIDERPEEVTDMQRSISGEVFASSNDSDHENHTRLARLVLEYAKRKVEVGKDVVLLLDSLTRMGRAFNSVQRSSGRTMSGGVDSRALEIPKRIFGSARALEGKGSLTIIATVLVETNSRMDELIFQEFKGTGNMELVLSRDLANERIFPAIQIAESGTRREELLFGGDTARYQTLRRALHHMKPRDAMMSLLRGLHRYSTNEALLSKFANELQ
jgi:transcription termination factor Rho